MNIHNLTRQQLENILASFAAQLEEDGFDSSSIQEHLKFAGACIVAEANGQLSADTSESIN